jgi:caspase 7
MCASYNPYHEENDAVYSLDFAIPGKVFIFNNRIFDDESDYRGGSEKDVDRLCDLFERLNFEIECFIDKTADQIRARIRKISKVDYDNVGCVLMFIMSHGTDGKIFGTDGEAVNLRDFVDPFKKVSSLKDKPKMFFVNACRGNKMTPTHDHKKLVEMDAKEANEDLFKANKTPLDADFLFAYSTVADYYSIRDSEDGSWFIQILCDQIERFKSEKHILDIMTKVIRVVSKQEGRNRKGNLIKMYPTSTTQLSKDFYFVNIFICFI